MPSFHPDTSYLTDYAAGSLPLGLSIAVASHLEYCPLCRQVVEQLEAVGDLLVSAPSPHIAPPSSDLLADTLAKIDALGEKPAAVEPTHRVPLLDKLTGGSLSSLDWNKLSSELQQARLKTGDNRFEVSLYEINAGGKIPEHRHNSDEVTLVLKGSFSDLDGIYKEGDFIVRSKGEIHRPIASQDRNCLCLSVQDQPISFTGWKRLFNPLLNVHPH